jgi:hypothetical protein
MPGTPFREMVTLSDAVELIGRRLYGETWIGQEYLSRPGKSPDELARERKPLEEEISATEAEIREIEVAIQKSIDPAENRRLAKLRAKRKAHVQQLQARLSLDHPLNDIIRDSYDTHMRWHTATKTFVDAIKAFKLRVHDGRGRELNPAAWSNPKFRYYLELSLIVTPRSAGEDRRQPARIDRDPLNTWLATLKPIVEPPPAPPRELSPEQQVTGYLQQKVASARGGPHQNKDTLRKEALAQIPGATGRMFDRVWQNVVPPKWRESGAPRKTQRPRSRSQSK